MVGAVIFVGLLQLVAFVWQAIRLGQTIGVMKDTAEKQLRAYVYLEITTRPYPPPPKTPDRISVSLKITNGGVTWANNLRTKHGMVVDPKTPDPFDSFRWDTVVSYPLVLGPGQFLDLQFPDVHGVDLPDIVQRNRRIFFVAWVTYEDALTGKVAKRQTQLLREFTADAEGGVSFSYFPTHNCADDACPQENCPDGTDPQHQTRRWRAPWGLFGAPP
jgi:hypothetical protein